MWALSILWVSSLLLQQKFNTFLRDRIWGKLVVRFLGREAEAKQYWAHAVTVYLKFSIAGANRVPVFYYCSLMCLHQTGIYIYSLFCQRQTKEVLSLWYAPGPNLLPLFGFSFSWLYYFSLWEHKHGLFHTCTWWRKEKKREEEKDEERNFWVYVFYFMVHLFKRTKKSFFFLFGNKKEVPCFLLTRER